MSNNEDSVTACIEPDFGLSIEKVAYPQRSVVDPALGVDVSGATVGFGITITNT